MRWYHFVRVRKTLQTSARNGRYLLQGGVTLTGQALSGLVPSPPHRGGAASAARRVRVLRPPKFFPRRSARRPHLIQRMATLTGAGGITAHSIFFLWSAAQVPCASCGEKLSKRAR